MRIFYRAGRRPAGVALANYRERKDNVKNVTTTNETIISARLSRPAAAAAENVKIQCVLHPSDNGIDKNGLMPVDRRECCRFFTSEYEISDCVFDTICE